MTPSESSLFLSVEQLNACVHCGLCLPTCATYQATGSEAESPRGRLYLMKKWMEGSLTQENVIKPYLDHCLACHACETACPSGVEYGSLLFQTREHLAKNDKSAKRFFKRSILKNALPNANFLNFTQKSLRLYQQSGLQSLVRKSKILRIIPNLEAQEILLPDIPEHYGLKPGIRFGNTNAPLIALMTGCVMDAFFNPIHWQTIFVLVKNGYQVLIPEQTCCGALAHHAGEFDIATDLAKKNIETILTENPDWIVLNSAGCGSTMKNYDTILAHETELSKKAKEFSDKVIDIMALLAQKPLTELPSGPQISQNLLYHAACHLYHVQKVQKEPINVLRQLNDTTVVPLENIELCCGSAGVYNLEYPELADEMLDKKLDSIELTLKKIKNNDIPITLVSGNPGCLMQLAKGLKERAYKIDLKHPIEFLAKAYGYNGVQDVMVLQQI